MATIRIDNLTINITASEAATHNPMAHLGRLLDNLADDESAGSTHNADQPQTPHAQPTPEPQLPAFTEGNILDFLTANEDYKHRSPGAVSRHFGVSLGEVYRTLQELHEDGRLNRVTRRSDGSYLYQAA